MQQQQRHHRASARHNYHTPITASRPRPAAGGAATPGDLSFFTAASTGKCSTTTITARCAISEQCMLCIATGCLLLLSLYLLRLSMHMFATKTNPVRNLLLPPRPEEEQCVRI